RRSARATAAKAMPSTASGAWSVPVAGSGLPGAPLPGVPPPVVPGFGAAGVWRDDTDNVPSFTTPPAASAGALSVLLSVLMAPASAGTAPPAWVMRSPTDGVVAWALNKPATLAGGVIPAVSAGMPATALG